MRAEAVWGPLQTLALTDQLAEALIVADHEGRISYANPAADRLLGWPPGALIGELVHDLVPVRYRDRHLHGFQRFVDDPTASHIPHPLRLPALRADGSEVAVEFTLRPISVGATGVPTHVVGSFRTLSGQFESKPAAAELAALLLPVLAEATTLEGAITDVLDVLADALGCTVGAFWAPDASTDDLVCQHFRKSTRITPGSFEEGSQGWRLALGEGLPGRVWASRKAEWITDVRTDPTYLRTELAISNDLQTAFAFPVGVPERFLGVIELYARHLRQPDLDLLESLESVGVELGQFLDRRRIEDERADLQRGITFLAEASSLLATSLEPERVLADVADLAVPTLAQWCVVRVLENGAANIRAFVHEDPAQRELLAEVYRRFPLNLERNYGTAYVLRTGRSTFERAVPDDWRDHVARDPEHRTLLEGVDLTSVVIVPLTARGRVLGSMMLVGTGGRRLEASVNLVAEELGRRAGVALDNAQMHQDLALREALLRTQSESGLEGMVVLSDKEKVLSHNHRFVEMFDLPENLVELGVGDPVLKRLVHQVIDPDRFIERSRELVATQQPGRDEVRLKDGRVFDRHGSPLLSTDGTSLGYAWYFRDVSDERRVQQQLFESGERFATLARTLQQSLLPPDLPDVPGLELAALYRPAGSGIDVGGDFYDVFRIGRGRWGVVIGDVCGKGAEAAALTALSRYTIRAAAMQTRSPARALAITNEAIRREIEDDGFDARFATIAFLTLTVTRRSVAATLSLGGHLRPVHIPKKGPVEFVGRTGGLLGLFPQVDLRNTEITLHEGDALLLYTDGVTEARSQRGLFGDERLLEVLDECRPATASGLVAAVDVAVTDHEDRLSDDMALLAVRVAPSV